MPYKLKPHKKRSFGTFLLYTNPLPPQKNPTKSKTSKEGEAGQRGRWGSHYWYTGRGEDVSMASADTRPAPGALMGSWACLPVLHPRPSAPPCSPSAPPLLPSPCPSVPLGLPSGILSVRCSCLSYMNCSGRGRRSHPGHGHYSVCRPQRPRTAGLLNLYLLHDVFVFPDFWISDLQLRF